jgi:hypothetical protein
VSAQALSSIGDTLSARNKRQEALGAFEAALALNPTDSMVRVRSVRACMLVRSCVNSTAHAWCSQLLRVPWLGASGWSGGKRLAVQVLLNMAIIHHQSMRLTEAIQLYEKLVPPSPPRRLYLKP